MGNKVVYRHRRLDNNEVFYIGMGNNDRPYMKNNRNIYWNNIVNKCGYDVEIICKNLSLEYALELEQFLIQEYGRNDLRTGKLVNLTDGGFGVNGHSVEAIEKIRNRLLGKKQEASHVSNMKKSTLFLKKPIIQYDLNNNFIKEFNGVREASLELNMGYSQLQRVLRGKRKTTRGFVFKFK